MLGSFLCREETDRKPTSVTSIVISTTPRRQRETAFALLHGKGRFGNLTVSPGTITPIWGVQSDSYPYNW